MKIAIAKVDSWLLGIALLLLLLYVGGPLLVPLGIALMLWAVLNAFAEFLQRARCPAWLSWIVAFLSIAASMYLVVFIVSTESVAFASRIPGYADRLQSIWSAHEWLRRAMPSLSFDSIGGETYASTLLREAIGSIGGTLARRIIDGATSVSLFGEDIAVRARVHTINGFSAHADQAELLAWHERTGAARTFLVHGEREVMQRFAEHLRGTEVHLPAPHQAFTL